MYGKYKNQYQLLGLLRTETRNMSQRKEKGVKDVQCFALRRTQLEENTHLLRMKWALTLHGQESNFFKPLVFLCLSPS